MNLRTALRIIIFVISTLTAKMYHKNQINMLGQNKTSNKQGQFITSGGSVSIPSVQGHKSSALLTQDEGFAHNGSKTSGNDTDPKRWKVLMYQIPVPLGDCSIYVLMYDNIIQNCFIMDGGTTSGGVHADEQIKTAWKAIKEELKGNVSRTNKKQNPSPLRFDSWVVTHWDQDHWRGVADLVGEPQGKNNVSDIEDYFTEERTIISGATCDAYLLYVSHTWTLQCSTNWAGLTVGFKGKNHQEKLLIPPIPTVKMS